MKYASFLLVFATLVLIAGCGPAPQVAQSTAAPAPTAAPTPLPPTAAPTLLPPTAMHVPTTVPTRTNAELTDRIDTMLTKLAEKDMFSGTVLIMRADEVVLRKGYGYADKATKTLNTPETVYRIGDMTKHFTAAAILLLESQGKLTLQDSICNYIDDCPAAWKPVTLHHLLSHSAGMPSYTADPAFLSISKKAVTPDALIALVRDQPLRFAPGTQWDISETNFVLLGMVIERVSKQPYATFVQEQLFAPLKMTATGYTAQPVGLATGNTPYNPSPRPFDVSAAYAAYGLSSTVDDVHRWDQALFADELLPSAQRDKMLSTQIHAFDVWDWGYGTALSDSNRPGHHIVLTGVSYSEYPGFLCMNVMITDVKFNWVILANRELGDTIDFINDSIADMLLGKK